MTRTEKREYIYNKGWRQKQGDSRLALWVDPKGDMGPQSLETAGHVQMYRDKKDGVKVPESKVEEKVEESTEPKVEESTEEVSEEVSEDTSDKKKKRRR